jgi:hypothetical protein
MFMNNELKQFREIAKNRNRSAVAQGGMTASFKYLYNRNFFSCNREILLSQAQVKYMPKNRNNNF